MAGGYVIDHAWDWLVEMGFYPEGSPYEKTPQPHTHTRFEETSETGKGGTVTFANPGGSMNIMVLFDDSQS